MDINSIELPNNKFEKVLNVAGYVPVIGTLSGITRIIYGIAKAIFAKIKARKEPNNEVFKNNYRNGIEQIKRGLCELPPFLSILLLRKRVSNKEIKQGDVTFNAELKGGKFKQFSSVKYTDNSLYVGAFSQKDQDKPNGKGTLILSDNTVYTGTFYNEKFPVKGTITYENKDVYTGPQKEGKPNGEGEKTISDGTTFKGEWTNGELVARIYEDGSRYEGGYSADSEGKPNGQGTLTLSDETVYEGTFTGGQFPVDGTITYKDTYTYTGAQKEGEPHGTGTKILTFDQSSVKGEWENGELVVRIYDDGSRYEGELSELFQDEPAGIGALTLVNGDVIKGKFEVGERYPSKGTIEYQDGETYTGPMSEGKPLGEGEITLKYGNLIKGEFDIDNRYPILGTIIYKNGDSYFGPLEKGKPNEVGVLTLSNGDRFEGVFNTKKFPNAATKLKYQNGNIYVGDLKRGKPSGQGTINRRGEEFSIHAIFEDGKIKDFQKIVYHTGAVYAGDVDEYYLPHGLGMLTTPEGHELQKRFNHGEAIERAIDMGLEGDEENQDNELVGSTEPSGMWNSFLSLFG